MRVRDRPRVGKRPHRVGIDTPVVQLVEQVPIDVESHLNAGVAEPARHSDRWDAWVQQPLARAVVPERVELVTMDRATTGQFFDGSRKHVGLNGPGG